MKINKQYKYQRVCRDCDESYPTSHTHSRFCGECKMKRRRKNNERKKGKKQKD